jgi:hypothetical protein
MTPVDTDGPMGGLDDLVAVQRLLAWYFAGEREAVAEADRPAERP